MGFIKVDEIVPRVDAQKLWSFGDFVLESVYVVVADSGGDRWSNDGGHQMMMVRMISG